MEEGTAERTGLFVVRAWRERDVTTFRARLTWTLDIETGESRTSAASTVAEVSRALQQWLDGFDDG